MHQVFGSRTSGNPNVVTFVSLRQNQNLLEIEAIKKKLYFNFDLGTRTGSQLLLYLTDMVTAFEGFLSNFKFSYEQKIDFSENSLKGYVLSSEFLQKDREKLLKKNNSNGNEIIFGTSNINNPLSALLNYLVFGYEIILSHSETPGKKFTLSQVLENKIGSTEDVCPKYYRKVTNAVKIFKNIKTAKKTTIRATGNSLSKLLAANSAQISLETIDCTDHLPLVQISDILFAKNILFLYYYFHFFKKLFVLSNIASLGVPQMVEAILSPNLGEYVQQKLEEEKQRISDLEKNLAQLQTKEPSFTVPLNGKISEVMKKEWGVAAGSNGHFFRYNQKNNTIILAKDENFYRKNQLTCKYYSNNIDFLETGGGGDCFFHALAAGINLQKEPEDTNFITGETLRNIFANCLKTYVTNSRMEDIINIFIIDIDHVTLKNICEKIMADDGNQFLVGLLDEDTLNEIRSIITKNNLEEMDLLVEISDSLKVLLFVYYIKIPGNYIIDAYFPFIFNCFGNFFNLAGISFFSVLKCDAPSNVPIITFPEPSNIRDDQKGLIFVLMSEHYRLAMLLEKNINDLATSTYTTLFSIKKAEEVGQEEKIAQYETLNKKIIEFDKQYEKEMRYLKLNQQYEEEKAAKEKLRNSFRDRKWKKRLSPEVFKRLEKYAMLLQAMKIVNDSFDPFGYTSELEKYNNSTDNDRKKIEEEYKKTKSLVVTNKPFFETPTENYNIAPIKLNENYYYKFPSIFYEGNYNDFVGETSYKEFLKKKNGQKRKMNENFRKDAEKYINDNVKLLLLETLGPEDEQKRNQILEEIDKFLTNPQSTTLLFTEEAVDNWKNLLNLVYENRTNPINPLATSMNESIVNSDRAPFASDVYTSKWLRRTAY